MANNWLRIVDFTLWVATIASGIIGGLAVISFIIGDGMITLKYSLFIVGFLLFGVGSFGLQPKRPHRDEKLVTVDSDSEYGFEERIQEIPPLDARDLPLENRVSRNVKIFFVSIILLAVSYMLEVEFGVTV